MSFKYKAVTLIQVITALGIIAAVAAPTAEAQGARVTKSPLGSILGSYSGKEPAFKDDDGELTGPSTYVFHILPNGRCFMDWANQRPPKSGRTFGHYTITSAGKEITVEAQFIPSMDSVAVEPPATDFFSTFTFRFSHRKVTVKYMEDSNAPTFLLMRVGGISK